VSSGDRPPLAVLEIRVPWKIYEALDRAEKVLGVKKEDIVSMAIVKVLEELGVEK